MNGEERVKAHISHQSKVKRKRENYESSLSTRSQLHITFICTTYLLAWSIIWVVCDATIWKKKKEEGKFPHKGSFSATFISHNNNSFALYHTSRAESTNFNWFSCVCSWLTFNISYLSPPSLLLALQFMQFNTMLKRWGKKHIGFNDFLIFFYSQIDISRITIQLICVSLIILHNDFKLHEWSELLHSIVSNDAYREAFAVTFTDNFFSFFLLFHFHSMTPPICTDCGSRKFYLYQLRLQMRFSCSFHVIMMSLLLNRVCRSDSIYNNIPFNFSHLYTSKTTPQSPQVWK